MSEITGGEPSRQDREHLGLLATFHYIVGGLAAAASLCFVPHLIFGGLLSSGQLNGGGPPEMQVFGAIFMFIPLIMIFAAWGLAVATVIAGRYLRAERNWTYCLVVAAILCFFAPFGTILGVFTIIVLMRPSVKQLFQDSQTAG